MRRPAAGGRCVWLHPGFDLLAVGAGGERRCIEVKGRAGRDEVWLEDNEYRAACNLGRAYWLYVVLDCATAAPQLARVRGSVHQAGREEDDPVEDLGGGCAGGGGGGRVRIVVTAGPWSKRRCRRCGALDR